MSENTSVTAAFAPFKIQDEPTILEARAKSLAALSVERKDWREYLDLAKFDLLSEYEEMRLVARFPGAFGQMADPQRAKDDPPQQS